MTSMRPPVLPYLHNYVNPSGFSESGRDPFNQISGNFGPKLNGSVRSNWKRLENAGPPFEVDHFSRSDRSEFWLNGSRPIVVEL